MKTILTWALCLGLVSTVPLQAADNDKREKKARRHLEKVAKQEAKAQRKFNRRISGNRVQIEQAVAPQVNAEVRLDADRNRRITRRGPRDHAWEFSEARQRHRRHVRRDRSWYRSNFNRFALFAGGYYYWDRGYWYPAYGYDPVYSTYTYDEPIYGYSGLDPRQVIVNVQVELKRRGYYRGGAVDGLLGPMTRRALARYQRDRGLYVTRSIDGPTLAALGLT